MTTIASVQGLEVLDSRGFPTVLVRVCLSNDLVATAMVPSGASTGAFEAIEKRDISSDRFHRKGVASVVASVNGEINRALQGKDPFEQAHIDRVLIELDGTENKSRLGANAILGTSLAVARAAAMAQKKPLWQYLGGQKPHMPCPMCNILNGGAHAGNSVDFQEFMIRPHAAETFAEKVRWSAEIYQTLKAILKKRGANTSVGDEGGFAPDLSSDEEALELLVEAISKSGFTPGQQVSIALDCAANELYDQENGLYIEKKHKARGQSFKARSTQEQVDYLADLVHRFPIDSIEDGLAETDWAGWQTLQRRLGNSVQIVGDDLFVTNPKFLSRGIEEKSANAILIKLNQIGTLTETIQTIKQAQNVGWNTIVSHRSGETEDTFIADLVVALHCGQIKTGAPCRSERTAKYNRLLYIEAFESKN